MYRPIEINPIKLSEPAGHPLKTRPVASMGNADVLSRLLPQLQETRFTSVKPSIALTQVDHYMLEEIEQIGARMDQYCKQIRRGSWDEITIRVSSGKLEIKHHSAQRDALARLINNDRWMKSALAWLHPNLVALAKSREYLAFSKLYQQSPTLALDVYSHLEQERSDMSFTLSFKNQKTSICLESPVNIYVI